MRAEERHELRENHLANWLHYGMLGWLRQNGSYLLLIAALGFLGYQLWNRHKQTVENERLSANMEINNAQGLAFLPHVEQRVHVADMVVHMNEAFQADLA